MSSKTVFIFLFVMWYSVDVCYLWRQINFDVSIPTFWFQVAQCTSVVISSLTKLKTSRQIFVVHNGNNNILLLIWVGYTLMPTQHVLLFSFKRNKSQCFIINQSILWSTDSLPCDNEKNISTWDQCNISHYKAVMRNAVLYVTKTITVGWKSWGS